MSEMNKTLLVIGSGPGISRAVTSLFSSKRYSHVALISRRTEQLQTEKQAVQKAIGSHIEVGIYAADVADSKALVKALSAVDRELGKPECIFYNAARVLPSQLLSHDVGEIEYDFKINVSGLYVVAQRYMPDLVNLAKTDTMALPALIVTSSHLPQSPEPPVFSLSLVKAAQRNLVQSLSMTYACEGVHIGVINVGGEVSPEQENRNPENIAAKTWEWFAGYKDRPAFEIVI